MLRNNNAFTLAEVLITLGIIGVVAAMTLPNLIHKQQMMELENRFKVAYSMIFQAVQTMGLDDPSLWQTYCPPSDNRDANFLFINDFSKQFQIIKLYKSNTSDLRLVGYEKSSYTQTPKALGLMFNNDGHNNGVFVTKNGMVVASSGCWWTNLPDFIVDTNGTKGPNKFGYDVFYFQIAKNNLLLPSNSNYSFNPPAAQSLNCCDTKRNNCVINGDNGVACSYFALKDRLPSDETKSYWKNLPKP